MKICFVLVGLVILSSCASTSSFSGNREPQQTTGVGQVGSSSPKSTVCDATEEALNYGLKIFTIIYNYNMDKNEIFSRQDLYGSQSFKNLNEIYASLASSKFQSQIEEKQGSLIANLALSYTFYNNLPINFAGKGKPHVNTFGGSQWQKASQEISQADFKDIFCK